MLGWLTAPEKRRSLPDAVKYFRAIEWLKKYIEDDRYDAPKWINTSQYLAGSNRLIQVTFTTPNTLPHFVMMFLKDLKAPPVTEAIEETAVVRPKPTPNDRLPEAVTLVHFGGSGLDGWPGVTHGGINCTLLDHAMGNLITAHRMFEPEGDYGGALLTGNLTISFFAPLKTKGRHVIIKSWVTSRSHTKWTTLGQILDEEGNVLTQGEGLFIIAGGSKL